MLSTIKHAINVARGALHEIHKKSTRSPHWPAVEKAHLKLQPRCAACSCTARLQVHHIKPFHMHPELELDFANLITLCLGLYECHLRIGHGGNFRMANLNVVASCAAVKADPSCRAAVEATAKLNRVSAT